MRTAKTLSLHWAHMALCRFCHEAAHIMFSVHCLLLQCLAGPLFPCPLLSCIVEDTCGSAPLLFAYGKNRFSHDVAHLLLITFLATSFKSLFYEYHQAPNHLHTIFSDHFERLEFYSKNLSLIFFLCLRVHLIWW